jgi:hypothetical protein
VRVRVDSDQPQHRLLQQLVPGTHLTTILAMRRCQTFMRHTNHEHNIAVVFVVGS